MKRITGIFIEGFCIELLEKQGYEYIQEPDISTLSKELLLELKGMEHKKLL